LQKSNNLVQEVSKLEENVIQFNINYFILILFKFQTIDSVELDSIQKALETLEQTYSEIDAYEVVIAEYKIHIF
jgi:hypothetical protein